MSKIAVNNEIVLMRQAVRQSRVSVVRKLIKESKLLRARKHGDEKIREKCKRKSDRLVAEIASMKKIKDDEISKFGITETRSLQEILSDLKAEPSTRIMARLAFHKILHERIAKFKEKFPEYEEHLGPGRKKLSKLQRKANREARNGTRDGKDTNDVITNEGLSQKDKIEIDKLEDDVGEEENDDIEVSEDLDEPVEDEIDENIVDDETIDQTLENKSNKDDSEPGDIIRVKTPKSTSKKRKNDVQCETEVSEQSEKRAKPEKTKKSTKSKSVTKIPVESKAITKISVESKSITKIPVESKAITKIPVETKKSVTTKVISKEATVKRFTDLIDDKESLEIVKQPDNIGNVRKKNEIKIEKQIDAFFMTENGESEYMSVVVPKSELIEDNEQDDRFGQNHAAMRQKNFHERNNKFFSKIDQRSGNDYGDKFGSQIDKRRANNYTNGRGNMEKFPRTSNEPMRNARNVMPKFEKKNDVKDEELHPSWAARKKQQEILKQGFQGKKIVFDD